MTDYTETKREKLAKSILYLLHKNGEMKPRELAAALESNTTDVNEALTDLRLARPALIEREQIARSGTGDFYVYRPIKARPPEPTPAAPKTPPRLAETPTQASRFLWSNGRKVAKVSESVRNSAQTHGMQGYGELRIEGPRPTPAQYQAASARKIALPSAVYMRVKVIALKAEGHATAYGLELINPDNLAEYLKWFPTMHLGPNDVRG